MARARKKTETTALEKDRAATYNSFKDFEGQRYTGTKIGGHNKWHYDSGVWTEKKLTPDEWELNYSVVKRRAGHAPEGSGVPVGTQYHWYVVAHQIVTKLNANDYSTSLAGVKFKLAHKRADKESWSASRRTQRKRAVQWLRSLAEDLEKQSAEEEQKVVAIPAISSAGRRRTKRNARRAA